MTDAQLPDAEVIRAALSRGEAALADVHVFSTLGSTSAWLREQRELFSTQLEQGRAQVCVTDWQHTGEGRRGKSFQTSPGNLTFSVLSRVQAPTQQLLGLSLVTGMAVAQALENVFDITVMLKWPNDVMLNERKLGGLLTELVSAAPGKSAGACTDIITGIGINVLHDELVSSLGIGATSLSGAGIDVPPAGRDALIGDIGATVMAFHERFVKDGWDSFASDWKGRDWLAGKAVSVHKGEVTEHAVAYGVNEQGALLVEIAGKLQPLYGGNVSIRPTV